MRTLGERLVEWLETIGIDTVFGIPGVHTVEMYRGLAASRLAHVTPRHEQGAGFMADGYARASGKPAAVFVITGPGLTNVITAMAQAAADSVPMLVFASVNARGRLGLGTGDLHEVRHQALIGEQAAAFAHTVMTVEEVPAVLARALSVFQGTRPRPVLIEVPRDLFAHPADHVAFRAPAPMLRAAPAPAALARAARWLADARAPVLLAGGGARDAAAAIRRLAERLAAPVVLTTNGRGILAPDHPLAVPASPSLAAVRRLTDGADVVLALGTEIGPTDYDMYERGAFRLSGRLIRAEIEAEQMRRGLVPDLPLLGDAGEAAEALIAALGAGAGGAGGAPGVALAPLPREPGGAARAAAARSGALDEIGPRYRRSLEILRVIQDALPEAPLVGDSTEIVYAGNLAHAAPAPRRWFNAATGYGALGYGLPAAIGAARAIRGPTVCLAGDGGLQFSVAELGTAVEERLPVVVIVWNNRGYGEIKRYMIKAKIAPVGVDLATPDFVALAHAWGAAGARVDSVAALPGLIAAAAARPGPTVLELDEAVALAGLG